MGNAVVKLGMAGMDATNDYALARKNLVVGEENVMIQLVNACAICHGKAVYAMYLIAMDMVSGISLHQYVDVKMVLRVKCVI